MDNELKKHVVKTGTTTVGIVCKDGIVLAADRRASFGTDQGAVLYIAGKDQDKIVEVTPDIIVSIAGVASDTRRLIKIVKAELKLKELRSKKKPVIKEAANLFSSISYENIRQPSMILPITHFLLAGKDGSNFYLYDISPDGFLKEISKYAATGSGMTSVNPILDTYYEENMSLDEGIELAKKCVSASMGRDPGTGEGINIFVVKKDKIKAVEKKELVQEFKDIKEK